MDEWANSEYELLFEQIKNIISRKAVEIKQEHPDKSFLKVQEAIAYLSICLNESNDFLKQLSIGNLNAPSPNRHNFLAGELKELHAGLKHLTWQAGQVANGDYKQKVSFLGEFSESFNAMIRQLEERESKLITQAAELSQSMELMVSIMDKVKEWVIALDQETGEIIYVNRSARENYYDEKSNKFHCQQICGKACMLMEKLSLLRRSQAREKQFNFSCPFCERILWVEFNRILWNDRYAYVYFLEDVTHEIGERQELQTMAFQDEMTGLYNRRYCMAYLGQLIDQRKLFSVGVVDLNRLKLVNDTYGHLKGDEYIITVSEQMSNVVKDTEGIACRIGGDEFVLLMPEFSQEQTQEILKQLSENIAQAAKNKDFPMSISYGAVDVLPRTNIALERILQEADDRMYLMKKASREVKNPF